LSSSAPAYPIAFPNLNLCSSERLRKFRLMPTLLERLIMQILLFIFISLALANLIAISISLSQSPARKKTCQTFLWINFIVIAIALALPIYHEMTATLHAPENGLEILGTVVIAAPVMIETLVLVFIYERRMNRPNMRQVGEKSQRHLRREIHDKRGATD
jgi:hypothetical protein